MTLTKGISTGNNVRDPHHSFPNDPIFEMPPGTYQNLDYCTGGTNIGWIKLWVDWRELHEAYVTPDAASSWNWMNTVADGTGKPMSAGLDEIVAACNARGLGVILTVYQSYPSWSNAPAAGDVSSGKKPETHVPNDRSATGPWAWFLGWLMARYRNATVNPLGPQYGASAGNPLGAYANFIEMVNEPNYNLWPLATMECAVTQMMQTAESLAAFWGFPGLLGPAVHDTRGLPNPPTHQEQATDFQTFTDVVVDALVSFRPRMFFVWSMHTYGEVETPSECSTWSACRVKTVQDALVAKSWLGGSGVRPIFISETGYPPKFEKPQSSLDERVRQNFQCGFNIAMLNANPSGVVAWLQHLWSDGLGGPPHHGLRDSYIVIPGTSAITGLGSPRPFYATFLVA